MTRERRARHNSLATALEVLTFEMAAAPDIHALLIFEDNDGGGREFVRVLPERVTAMSTGDLPDELERAGRIQSADPVLDEAAAAMSTRRDGRAPLSR